MELTIDGRKHHVSEDMSVLRACERAGVEVPTFCRDDRRAQPFTSCFLCLIEVEGLSKLVPSCGTKVKDGMVISVSSDRVKNARKMALELLLSDHNADCKAPCQFECPAHADVQGYVNAIANGDFKTSIRILRTRIPLPATLGRVCPHPCEEGCRRNFVEQPISIRNLKRFVADWDLENGPFMPIPAPRTDKKVAIVGSGPAGLSAAFYLRLFGHRVTIFERMPELGGMLRYGIPEYRLPKTVLDKEIGAILELGIQTKLDHGLGRDITLEQLETEYDAVFLAIGAWNSKKMMIKGEDHKNVIGGIDFLRDVALGRLGTIGTDVVIVGGGNTAIDAARTAMRLGARSTILYRRTKEEMPAEAFEIKDAEEEEVQFLFLAAPINLVFEGRELKGLECIRMELGEPDETGRRRPVPIEGSEFFLRATTVIKAIGQDIEEGILGESIDQTKYGTVKVQKQTYRTNRPKVFAGGDLVKGPALVVDAVYMGRKAAEAMNKMLLGQVLPSKVDTVSTKRSVNEALYEDVERKPRSEPESVDGPVRRTNFEEVDKVFTENAAITEANRCMSCGCQDLYECKLRRYMVEYQADTERFLGSTHNYKADDSHPNILREPNKCVKCGRCVEVCDEDRGISVYGFARRGFDAVVAPTLSRPLKDTECIACGDCVAVCPVGALTEKVPLPRPGPFVSEVTHTVCTRCSLGCSIDVHIVNGQLYRIVPHEGGWNDVHMCKLGRFDYAWTNSREMLVKPKMRNGNDLVDSSLEDALKVVSSKMGSSKAFILSPDCTNEEAYLTREIAGRLNGEAYLLTADADAANVLDRVLGTSRGKVTLDDIRNHEVVLVYDTDMIDRFSLAGVKIRQAAARGSRIVVVGDKPHGIKQAEVLPKIGMDFLNGLIVATLKEQQLSATTSKLIGHPELELMEELSMLSQEAVAERARVSYEKLSTLAHELSVRKSVIVFGSADREEARRIALLSRMGSAAVLFLTDGPNDRGISQLGIQRISPDGLDELIEESILMIGKSSSYRKPKRCKFLLVQAFCADSPEADLFLPRSSSYDNDGTVVTTDGRLSRLRRTRTGTIQNWQTLLKLSEALGATLEFEAIGEITEALLPELDIKRDDSTL